MEAYFDETDHPKVKIIVSGRKQKRIITAILDTGFDGYLSKILALICEKEYN